MLVIFLNMFFHYIYHLYQTNILFLHYFLHLCMPIQKNHYMKNN